MELLKTEKNLYCKLINLIIDDKNTLFCQQRDQSRPLDLERHICRHIS